MLFRSNLTEDFEINDGIIIPKGEYWFTRYELQAATFQGRPFYGFIFYQWGDYYNGKSTEWFIEGTAKLNNHISISSDFTQNRITLPTGNFTVNEFGGRANLAISPDLFGSIYVQWNNDDQLMLVNFRVNWIPTPGTDFYVVINQNVDTHSSHLNVTHTTVLTKFIWRFVM